MHVALAHSAMNQLALSVLLCSPALLCVGLSIDCVKHVAIELYTWTSICQSFFANNPGNTVSPNFFTAKVSYYMICLYCARI